MSARVLLYEISRHVQKSFAVLRNHAAACRQLLLVGVGELYIYCAAVTLRADCFRSGAPFNGIVMNGCPAGKLCNREDAVGEFLVFNP